jgi:hypothetical protein
MVVVDEFGREIPILTPSAGGGSSGVLDDPNTHQANRRRGREYYSHTNTSTNTNTGTTNRSSATSYHRQRQRPTHHPSTTLYVEEPLLCHFLWKDQQHLPAVVVAQPPPAEAAAASSAPPPADEAHQQQQQQHLYDAYRRKYCLQFVRAFFNQHLDDSWFRALYSPAARQDWLQLQRSRSIQEAAAFTAEWAQNPAAFVEHARLGRGQKVAQVGTTTTPPTPTSHWFSWQQPDGANTALIVSQIPAAVTDEQLAAAVGRLVHPGTTTDPHNNNNNNTVTETTINVYSSLLVTNNTSLQRHALVVAPRAVIAEVTRAGVARREAKPITAGRLDDSTSSSSSTTTTTTTWSLLVDGTDPYGRSQYDADGRGAAPAAEPVVVPRQQLVCVVQQPPPQAPMATLSAALSVRTRHAMDRARAVRMAQVLDEKRQVPDESAWRTVYEKVLQVAVVAAETNNDSTSVDSDVLDVCVAYLRRVHLVSFYHNCDQPAASVADVVSGKHAASTIRLRLQNADELLLVAVNHASPTDHDTNSTTLQPVAAQDMLVQRLDDRIEKALNGFAAWGTDDDDPSPYVLSPQQVAQASEIHAAQVSVRDQWLRDHSVVDADGRARCSFHFCHKLFKDNTFLHKHLLKKHVEYLHGETAKCHDAYMMRAWDAARDRTVVPDIWVDCGSRFGWVAARVTGQVPDCVDPEPELWAREEERRQRQMQARRDEVRYAPPPPLEHAPRVASVFVDVDDMKEVKVEVSFENVIVPPVVTTNRKKRKLL